MTSDDENNSNDKKNNDNKTNNDGDETNNDKIGHDDKRGAAGQTTTHSTPRGCGCPQNFEAGLGVKKVVTTVPVRKPDRQWFFRVHPDEAWRLPAAVIADQGGPRGLPRRS